MGVDLPTPGLPNMSFQMFRCGDHRGLLLLVRPIRPVIGWLNNNNVLGLDRPGASRADLTCKVLDMYQHWLNIL